MNCIECKYYNSQSVSYCNGAIRQLNMCKITNICNPKSCQLKSDSDVNNMDICYNCENWIGGGDWGLSCVIDYYNCNSNGFANACDKFVRKSNCS